MSDQTLPGRLGTPAMTLETDPRTDPRLLAALSPFELTGDQPDAPVTADGPLEAISAYVNEIEPAYAMLFDAVLEGAPQFEGLESSSQTITGIDGNEITIYIDRPANADGALPGIVHTHGGGMVLLRADNKNYVYWRQALAAKGMVVIGVEFRNGGGSLGDHPFPAGLNDCVSAAKWANENRDELGISKLVMSGESGGGNLSLATMLTAQREGWGSAIDGVYAQCPYISGAYDGSDNALVSLQENANYFLNNQSMEVMVRLYDPEAQNRKNPLAWPYYAAAEDLAGLPPHVISVNDLDPLRDEGLAYHDKLVAAGVSSQRRVVEGTCHAADCILPLQLADIFQASIDDIHRFAASL